MIPSAETFDGTWPYRARYSEAAGFRQHYVDEGPPDADETLVLLHGQPTWGYLWRNLIDPLARKRRVVVPDHMGFGKSATPADSDYLAREHVDNLEKLLVNVLDLHRITLVLHDWGGPIGAGFGLRHPDRIDRIIAINTVLPLGAPGYGELMAGNHADSAWFRWAAVAEADGTLTEVLGNAGNTVTHLMLALQTIARPEIVTPTWVRAYASHFTDRAECRGVIRFPQQIVAAGMKPPLPEPDPSAAAALRAKPAVLLEGMRDTALLPRYIIPAFRATFPDAPVIELPDAGHFPQEDAPEAVLAALELFLQTAGATANT
ncbi:alpha/beta fold hydrolase [Nocardia ninae]|uniref:Haloalkane dehalogenase 2 n=1 Tax=Nocardia ninae NBRC 108245 TaxID=1210091 RepID=A0A511MT81_9NOCA|nr:alpha/beta fold hydrolase [Nocardia ninae]GEM43793.1 haloalkane dehalogenase 2 [Nocardia ninae NBRC 108245]